jgi:predicted Zn-dependent peptidase
VENIERAKAQLKFALFNSIEDNNTFAINSATNILLFGKFHGTDLYVKTIDSITKKDLEQLLIKIFLGSTPAITVIGNVKAVETREPINAALAHFKASSRRLYDLKFW